VEKWDGFSKFEYVCGGVLNLSQSASDDLNPRYGVASMEPSQTVKFRLESHGTRSKL